MREGRQALYIYLRSLDRFLVSVSVVLREQRKPFIKTNIAICVSLSAAISSITLKAEELPKSVLHCPLFYLYQCVSIDYLISPPPASLYLLHLSLCPHGRGSGAFCLLM